MPAAPFFPHVHHPDEQRPLGFVGVPELHAEKGSRLEPAIQQQGDTAQADVADQGPPARAGLGRDGGTRGLQVTRVPDRRAPLLARLPRRGDGLRNDGGQHAFERGVLALNRAHRVVNDLADLRRLGLGLDVVPAGFGR